MQVKILNPNDYPHWDAQIQALDGATIFHTTAWAKVLSETYGYLPTYFTALQDGQVAGFLPIMDVKSFITGRRGVSLPFSDESHPVCKSLEAFNLIWQRAIEYGQKAKWKHIELRGGHPAYESEPEYDSFLVHTLDLPGSEQLLLSQFRSSTKRNIKKAVQSGVKVKKSHSLESMKAFYQLNCRTRKKHGLPPQPFKFFLKLHAHIIATKMGFTLLALHADTIIAAAVYLQFGPEVLYKFGASNDKYQHLRANNLLMWEAIRSASQDGSKHFDFGRTERENSGLLQFKRGWGAIEESLKYYRYDMTKTKFSAKAPKLKTSYPLFKMLPMPLLKLSGKILYRHVA
ncbi:MAG: peptidoglycan bridge formation glycyltransferase FemA/FemB family protein [Desulfobacteraceae bacterium]|nr:MAG: peptidoglycan bridge formation glycyltransferase FemA/FemB family protein [Desulfobacteraceae bacterium]